MVSRKLMGVWLALDCLLLISGLISVILPQVLRASGTTFMRMVFSSADLTGSWIHSPLGCLTHVSPTSAGTVLGVALITSFLISIVAFAQKNHVTLGFVVLNYALLLDAIGIIVIGTFVWWYTLEERADYYKLWLQSPGATRIELQDKVLVLILFPLSSLLLQM